MNIWSRSDPRPAKKRNPAHRPYTSHGGRYDAASTLLIGSCKQRRDWRANNYISQDEVMSEFLKDSATWHPGLRSGRHGWLTTELEDVVEDEEVPLGPFKVENVEERLRLSLDRKHR